MHVFSVWREPRPDDSAPTGPLWAKCHCGWTGYGRTYDDIRELTTEHREDAERLEQLEHEEATHAH